ISVELYQKLNSRNFYWVRLKKQNGFKLHRRWHPGKYFVSFLPAISNTAAKALRRKIHDWRIHLKPDKSIEDLSHMLNPIIRGWINYYGRFYKSQLYAVLRYFNRALTTTTPVKLIHDG
ncbi:MAG: group II intron maturase-specific domain-containing protein, partial [Deltaproteobacteria bacterium]|nr:group II intron maturase-specific domain-containing protein [Deltaproteobacteria bacterium]